MDDKKLEQLCQSDIVNTNNILHIIDSIEADILDHHFKYSFFSGIVATTKDKKWIKFDDEVDRVCKNMLKNNEDSFRALLLIQGKDKDDEKELDKLIKFLVEWRYSSLINQDILEMNQLNVGVNHTRLTYINRETLNMISRLLHIPEHDKMMEDADKLMKNMVGTLSDMGKNVLGDEFRGIDMGQLFENMKSSGGRKVDLSKILGTEKKEDVDIKEED